MITWIKNRLHREEKGSVLLIVAVMLPVLIGMLALVVDLGSQVAAKRTAVQAADAAALAVALDCTTTGSANAQATAEQLADANVSGFPGASDPIVTVEGQGCDPANHTDGFVEVTVTFEVPRYFAAILGVDPGIVSASATAGWEFELVEGSTEGPIPGGSPNGTGGQGGTNPGGGASGHGNSGQPPNEDPNADNGQDCEANGNGGVNEDHCATEPVWESDVHLVA